MRFSFAEDIPASIAFKLDSDRIMRTLLEIVTGDRGRASNSDKAVLPVSTSYKPASTPAHLQSMFATLTECETYDEIQIFDVNANKREFGLCVLTARPEVKLRKLYVSAGGK